MIETQVMEPPAATESQEDQVTLPKEELENKLRQLGAARQRMKVLDMEQKAEIVRASGKFAVEMVELDLLIEELEEEIKAEIGPLLDDQNKTWRCAAGAVTLATGQPKVVFDKNVDEADIIAALEERAPTLLFKKLQVNKLAIIAAAKTDDRGLITLAEVAGITVQRESTIKIKC